MKNPEETLSAIDGEWQQIGWTTGDGFVLGDEDTPGHDNLPLASTRTSSMTVTLTPQQAETLRNFADVFQRQHAAYRRAFLSVANSMMRVISRAHASTAPLIYGDEYRRHRRRCRACNPAGNPKPLKIDGREYARRRKNRRRHGR